MRQIETEPLESEGFTVEGFEVTPEMVAAAARVMLREDSIWHHLGAGGATNLAEEVIRAMLLARRLENREGP